MAKRNYYWVATLDTTDPHALWEVDYGFMKQSEAQEEAEGVGDGIKAKVFKVPYDDNALLADSAYQTWIAKHNSALEAKRMKKDK